jgi:hypothetical protein
MATTAELLPWYGLAKQGRIFTGNIAAAGVILPIYSNTTQQVGLWNPYGNTKDLIVKNIALTYVSGTGAAGGFAIGYLPNAPAAIGTGLAITAFTETAAVAGYGAYGSNLAASAKCGPGSTLTVTAPALLRQLGLNQTVLTAATTGSPQWTASFDFEGDLVVTPGSAIFVAGNIATLSTFSGSITWAEVDRL